MKKILNVPSIRDVKNIHSIGARCIPKVLRSCYLELYLHKKEAERLEKEIFVLNKRKSSIKIQLDSINKQIDKLQKEILGEQKPKSFNTSGPKVIKSMPIKY